MSSPDGFDDAIDRQEVDWTVLRSLLEAQSLTARAVEEYCLYATVDDAGDPSVAVADARRAIDRHRRIVEALELAAVTAERDGDDPGAPE